METVLIVDDEPLVGRSLALLVSASGWRGFYAQTSEEVMECLRREGELVVGVVVDYDMPGVDLATLVGSMLEFAPGLRLIGSSGRDRGAEFAALGITRFLPKPWTPAQLGVLLAP